MTIAPDPFALDVDTSVATSAVVHVTGELDMATAPELDAALLSVDGAHIVVDMSGVTFMDSSGTASLIRAYRRFLEGGGSFMLRAPSAQVAKVLQLTGVDRVLTIEPSD